MAVLLIIHEGVIFPSVLPDKDAAQKKFDEIKEIFGGTLGLRATVITDFDNIQEELKHEDGK